MIINRILFPQARDVLGVTLMVAGAALQRPPADTVRHQRTITVFTIHYLHLMTNQKTVLTPTDQSQARVTVTDLWTVELTMVTAAVRVTWCAAATTARSSEHTSTKRSVYTIQKTHGIRK